MLKAPDGVIINSTRVNLKRKKNIWWFHSLIQISGSKRIPAGGCGRHIRIGSVFYSSTYWTSGCFREGPRLLLDGRTQWFLDWKHIKWYLHHIDGGLWCQSNDRSSDESMKRNLISQESSQMCYNKWNDVMRSLTVGEIKYEPMHVPER